MTILKKQLLALCCFTAIISGLSPLRAQDDRWQFITGDVNHDGRSDLALFNRGEWYLWISDRNGHRMQGPFDMNFLTGGLYAMGDLDNDSRPDLAMLSGSDWFFWRATNNYEVEGPINCGVSNGVPYLHDFDEDRCSDPCVMVDKTWHVWLSKSNYAKRIYGFDPGPAYSSPPIPVAFDWRHYGPLSCRDNYYGYMFGSILKCRKINSSDTNTYGAVLCRGVPLFGNFSDSQCVTMEALTLNHEDGRFRYCTFLARHFWERRGPWTLCSDRATGVAGMLWADTNGCYAAASVYDIGDITNALVDINGEILQFKHELSFNTSTGHTVKISLPFYYAELTNVHAGDSVVFSVRTNSHLMYQSQPTIVPAQVRVLEPQPDTVFQTHDPVPVSWTAAAGSQGYLLSYDRESKFESGDEPYQSYVAAPQTTYTIPTNCIVKGDAEFGVMALNGDVQALLKPDDTNDSFFLTASWDEVETLVEEPIPPPEFIIVKEYHKREEGLTFLVRESDPCRMTAPGRITVDIKSRRRKLSVAFVAAFDMQGKQYFGWDMARIYKRKSKWYSVTFPCQPYSTIVIGTHKASYLGTRYDIPATQP